MTSNFLEINNLNKKFGNINALKNVSLNVSKGEVIMKVLEERGKEQHI